MSLRPDKNDPILNHFDAWLKTPSAVPRKDFLRRLKIRLHQPAPNLEERLDALFQPDPRLYDPDLPAKIRQSLEAASSARSARVPWFQWAAPLAATLILGLAFYSFQQSAPTPAAFMPTAATDPAALPAPSAEDPELTRIFALAANLQSTPDMARLKSVDDLAYLFD
ncbi:MAG TPA: hypothetical protein VJ960_06505 [Oceanipulchritudo sp.]|nr:hypothetical protein [Oceanipulchritudo sp.]